MKTDVELEGVGVLLMVQGEDDMVLLVEVAHQAMSLVGAMRQLPFLLSG